MKKNARIFTGIIIAAGGLTLWALQGVYVRVALSLFMLMCMWEMYDAFRAHGDKPARWVGILYALLVAPVYHLVGAWAILPLICLCAMLSFMDNTLRGEPDLKTVVVSLFPVVYPGALFTVLLFLQDLSRPLFVTVALGLTFLGASMCDMFAYFIGSKFGKHKLAPQISPKKTVEGAVGGLVGSVLFAVLVPFVIGKFPCYAEDAQYLPALWKFAVMGIFLGVFGQFGDLAASVVKRSCGIKDFSTIFPGHGGMMDRMDSVLFAGVVVYAFFSLFA